ncbi:MAG: quercetin 2,3-dioxygenase, partial [Thermomonas sp.]
PDGAEASLAIRQQAWLRASRLHADDEVTTVLDPSRRYWLHVTSGEVRLGERVLQAGDALGFIDEAGGIELHGNADITDVLLFDLPA